MALSFETTDWQDWPFQVPSANPRATVLSGSTEANVAVAVPLARELKGKVRAPFRLRTPENVSVKVVGSGSASSGVVGPGSSQAAKAAEAATRTSAAKPRVSADKGGNVRESRARRMATSVLGFRNASPNRGPLASTARSTLSFPLERFRYRPLMSRQTITLAVLAVYAVLVAGNAMAQTPPTTQTPPP